MENIIELKFNNTISRLAGNAFGKSTYINQVKDKINFNDTNIIIIPDYIEDIAISFVQGFTYEIFEKISKDEFNKYFIIQADDKIVNKFQKSVYF
ncbi:hypothetical protein [Clostridium tertium]|uniref:hypothetical protein n=1 Tax=Clostridium tertium TaxID=1559 RepID=UPI001AE29CC2|nr:hypothetical protein [Clostridium tertium]MBP1869024.1 hypothetical protein [Clostridium tertium]